MAEPGFFGKLARAYAAGSAWLGKTLPGEAIALGSVG